MDTAQRNAFRKAEDLSSSLMKALFDIRLTYYVDSKIPVDGAGVWQHIPAAQSLLERVKDEIEKAKKSVEELETRREGARFTAGIGRK